MSSTRQHRSGRLLGLAALPLAVALLASCNNDSTVAVGSPSDAPTTTAPTATAPASTAPPVAPATTAPATGTHAVAVYYLHDTTNGPRLYREFHRRPATTAVIRDAVTAMLTEAADDPDYTSLWPKSTRVIGTRLDGSTAIVDLSKEATTGNGGAAFEAASLQQLVWTATAADPSVKAVRLLIEGRKIETLWGHADTSEPMTRGQAAVELGPVWILTPVQGGSIKQGGRFGGEASVFEATVSWQLLKAGKLVKDGFETASNGAPGRGTWSAVADVPPGDYVLRAFESSANDGSETFVDDKRITVV